MKYSDYRISWVHNMDGARDFAKGTKCIIKDKEGNTIGVGYAVLSEKDQFSRKIGRKVSLSRALKSSNLDKMYRKGIWDLYRSNHNS